jgi:glutathione synthase
MNILFVADPLDGFKIHKDSTFAMMRELQRRGHQVASTEPRLMRWRGDAGVTASVLRIHLTGQADAWYSVQAKEELPLHRFDAVLMRKDPPFDMEYVYATHMLEYAEAQGARVFNSGAAIRNHPEKLAITEFSEFTAPTLVSRDMERIKAFHALHRDVIVKPLDGMGGTGVFRLAPNEANRNAILETLTHDGTRTIMAQRYIPEISQGDKRILIIGGEAVPFCLARIPLAGETRGNLAAGGRGVAQPLSERDASIARQVGPKLAKRGLLLVGLDVIGDYVTEVNVTSPTCFVEITEQTGFDVGARFVQALEAAVGHSS